MTLVIVVAAIGALVLLISILTLSRSRVTDESARFRHVSDLTSQWSRQQQMESQGARAADGAGVAERGGTDGPVAQPPAGSAADKAIDLRAADRGVRHG
jgi:hypothetical protein